MNGTYYVIQYNDTGNLVEGHKGTSPKLYQKKGQAEYLAKRYRGTVLEVILTILGPVQT